MKRPTILRMIARSHPVAVADQLAAELRDARCCDPFEPCDTHYAIQRHVWTLRRLTDVPTQRKGE